MSTLHNPEEQPSICNSNDCQAAYELDCLNEDDSTIKVWMIILNVNMNKGF
jgi:hypothetical protein